MRPLRECYSREVKTMQKETPKAKVTRSSNGDFIGAYPYPFPKEYDFPGKHPIETEPLRVSAASASEYTGIAVVQPSTEEEAQSLADVGNFPVTAADGTVSDGQ